MEVVDARGIIDGAIERAIVRTIELAERDGAVAVVLQIDSAGTLDAQRARRIADAVLGAELPVVTWIGPPGARAENGAAAIAMAGHLRVMAPGTSLGPARTLDLRAAGEQPELAGALLRDVVDARGIGRDGAFAVFVEARSADAAQELGVVDDVAIQLPDLLDRIDGREVTVAGRTVTLVTEEVTVRLRKPGMLGRILHAAAQPSMIYLLLLVGLVGLVFEVFHPDTGPAGISGLLGFGLGVWGLWTLGGSWIGLALIVAGVVGFCVDLRFQGLGFFTISGLGGLIAGSVLLFPGPWLHVNPWVMALGVIGMVLFLLGAMTRVLRDLRAVASGELEVTEAHPHPEPQPEPEQ